MNSDSLTQVIRDLIGRRSEGAHWDFKRRHHRNKGDLIHDVLCLANADHVGPRFLIFGVKDGGVASPGIEGDEGRRTQAQMACLFRDNASKFFQSRFPTFHLRTITIGTNGVDVLIVEDEPRKPYYLVERIENVRPFYIYTRVCDTNTPIDSVAQPHEIERMWRQRFGLDMPALEKVRRLLFDPEQWTGRCVEGFVLWYHDVFPEFTLRTTSAEVDSLDCNQEWTRGEIRIDNNHAGWYEIRCHRTLLRRVHYVSFDDAKKSMVAPDWRPVERGRFYFYEADSIRYSVQQFCVAKRMDRDDSRHLRMRGRGEAVAEARSRWGWELSIPVLLPGERRGFLLPRPGSPAGIEQPCADLDEQYELFVRSLLAFDDWRRTQAGGTG